MPDNVKIQSLLSAIEKSDSASDDIKKQAEEIQLSFRALESDKWIYRMVVVILGLAVVVTICGGVALAFFGDSEKYDLPSAIVAIGSAAVGALAGLLAPSPKAEG